MIETTIELRKLTAAEGMTLTNGKAFGKEVYLGKNDSAENWYEITEEEYQKIIEESEADLPANAEICGNVGDDNDHEIL